MAIFKAADPPKVLNPDCRSTVSIQQIDKLLER